MKDVKVWCKSRYLPCLLVYLCSFDRVYHQHLVVLVCYHIFRVIFDILYEAQAILDADLKKLLPPERVSNHTTRFAITHLTYIYTYLFLPCSPNVVKHSEHNYRNREGDGGYCASDTSSSVAEPTHKRYIQLIQPPFICPKEDIRKDR